VAVRKREFGRTNALVSEIGLGCGGYWGFPSFPEDRAAGIVLAAIESGVNFLDTGPNYSMGNAEARLGRIMRGRWGDLLVSTKVGSLLQGRRTVKDWTAEGIRASAEASLERLGVDRLFLVQFHSPSAEILEDDRAVRALASLKEEGLASHVGISASWSTAARGIDLGVFDSLMITYNVLHQRPGEEIIKRAARAGMAVLVKSPLAHVVYGPSFHRAFSVPKLWNLLRVYKNARRDLARSREFSFMNAVEGWDAPQVALRFVLENPHVTSAILGTTSTEHLRNDLAASGDASLPDEVLLRLRGLAEH